MAYARKTQYAIYRIGEWFYDYDIAMVATAKTREEAIEKVQKQMAKNPKAQHAVIHISKEEKFLADQKQKQKEWRETKRAESKAERKEMRFSKDVENAYYKTSYKASHLI